MNVLFLTIGKIDSIEKTQGIYSDLVNAFVRNEHDICVVSALEKRSQLDTTLEIDRNIKQLNVKVGNLTKTNLVEKTISTFLIEREYDKCIQQYFSNIRFDLILYSTPPITFNNIIKKYKIKYSAKTYLLLKDIFPQNAVDLNMFTNKGLIYKWFRQKEKQLYDISDYIGCMSQKNLEYTLEHNPEIKGNKVEICPNSITPIDVSITEIERQSIRIKYGLPLDWYIFIYGGNLGKPQGVEFLIECIEKNERNKDTYILVVGSGTEYVKLDNYFKTAIPQNAKLLSSLPKNDYEILVNSCDVGLIFLDRKFTIPNFPSRILSYMQASMPVLAATDPNTDLGDVIAEGEFGLWCESNNAERFNNMLLSLCDNNKIKIMGNNARKYLENHYTAKHTYDIIMSHFKD